MESQITRIVGKNESGKTALLEALAKSNYFEDNVDFQFDKDLDYPRSELIKVRTENPKVLTCEYELSDEDVKSVEEFFAEGILSKKRFSVTSYYDNTRATTEVLTDFGIFKDWLISAFGVGEQGKEIIHAATDYPALVSAVSENNSLPGMNEIKAELEKIKKEANGWTNPLEGYIYKEHELERETTCANFAHMGKDADQTYQTVLYNLDVIISVGYRVKSQCGHNSAFGPIRY